MATADSTPEHQGHSAGSTPTTPGHSAGSTPTTPGHSAGSTPEHQGHSAGSTPEHQGHSAGSTPEHQGHSAGSTPTTPGHSAGSTPEHQGHSAGSTPATLRELVASGLHPSTVSRRFTRILPMVYVRGEPSTMDRCHAGTLWRPDAVLSHRSAAYLRGWTTELAVLDATVPRTARLRPPPWLRLHRRTLDPGLVDEVASLPCTTPAQTILDCLAILPRAEAELLIDERLSFGLDPASLLCLLERFPHRRGNAELARQVRLAVAKYASELERALGRALHRLGLRLEMNANVGRFVCDFVDRRSRTIIEVDGREFHSAAGVFSKDRRRQNALVLDGWLVLRYSAFDVLAAPDRIALEIATVIRRRRQSRR